MSALITLACVGHMLVPELSPVPGQFNPTLVIDLDAGTVSGSMAGRITSMSATSIAWTEIEDPPDPNCHKPEQMEAGGFVDRVSGKGGGTVSIQHTHKAL
jgi:hypothetical protein